MTYRSSAEDITSYFWLWAVPSKTRVRQGRNNPGEGNVWVKDARLEGTWKAQLGKRTQALSHYLWSLSSNQKAMGSEQENGAPRAVLREMVLSVYTEPGEYSCLINVHVLRDLRIQSQEKSVGHWDDHWGCEVPRARTYDGDGNREADTREMGWGELLGRRVKIHLRGSASPFPYILDTLVSYRLPHKSWLKNVNNALSGFTSICYGIHTLTHVSHSEISLEIMRLFQFWFTPLTWSLPRVLSCTAHDCQLATANWQLLNGPELPSSQPPSALNPIHSSRLVQMSPLLPRSPCHLPHLCQH